jgi:hypothetical protein
VGKRILVGMLAAGENERDQAIASLRGQTHKDYELFIIENKPNKEAHEALYSRFMSEVGRFDIFFKLDADMVLLRSTALEEVANFFAGNPDVELILFELIDWYSDALIPGLVITRSTARWPSHPDQLMVDSYVKITGKNVHVSDRQAALAIHSPDPSPLQAFRFGVHRAMKAIQDDREPSKKMIEKANIHWDILVRTWANFLKKGDRRMGLAIAGAELAISRGSRALGANYMDKSVSDFFEKHYLHAESETLRSELGEIWNDPAANTKRWRAALNGSSRINFSDN